MKYDPEYFETTVLGILLPLTLAPELSVRHGATLATAEIILALHDCGHQLTPGKELSKYRNGNADALLILPAKKPGPL